MMTGPAGRAEHEGRTMDEREQEPEAAASEAEPLLPARLSPFAPPDPEAERRTAERLRLMSFAQLRSRRTRIDKRLFELGLNVGEQALAIPSVRGTGLVDLDRILRKLDALDHAREQARLEREVDREGKVLPLDLGWIEEALRAREVRARRTLLTSELGLALCAADQRVIAEYAPHLERLLEQHVATARRIDELFVEMRLVEEELERRSEAGQDGDPPREIDVLLTKALDSVDDVSSKVGDTLATLGRSAAASATRVAVRGSGQAVLGIAKSAWALGGAAVGRLAADGAAEEDEQREEEEARAPASSAAPITLDVTPRRAGAPPAGAASIPELIRQLAALRAEGILTEAEFEAKKAELLRRL